MHSLALCGLLGHVASARCSSLGASQAAALREAAEELPDIEFIIQRNEAIQAGSTCPTDRSRLFLLTSLPESSLFRNEPRAGRCGEWSALSSGGPGKPGKPAGPPGTWQGDPAPEDTQARRAGKPGRGPDPILDSEQPTRMADISVHVMAERNVRRIRWSRDVLT